MGDDSVDGDEADSLKLQKLAAEVIDTKNLGSTLFCFLPNNYSFSLRIYSYLNIVSNFILEWF